MRGKYFVGFVLAIVCLSLVSSMFTVGNLSHSVSTNYLKDSNLSGWVNLSFDLEPLTSKFTDSLGNSVSLEEILNISDNINFNYQCNVQECAEDYEVSNPETSKDFNLSNGKSKIIGFKLDEEILKINSASFDLESDVSASCNNQVKIDILDNGQIDYLNTKLSGNLCPNINKGCFNNTALAEEVSITTTPLCQRINFTEAPKFVTGAWIKQIDAGSKNIWMQVFDSEGLKIEECMIAKDDISSSGTYVSCNINLTVLSPIEHYVCILSDSGSGNYKTQGYNPEKPCGFAGYPPQTETSAYDIYIQKRKYDAVGILNIPNELPSGDSFGELIENYIIERYGNLNCSEGCVVPVRIISGDNQEITLKNLDLNYDKLGLPGVSEDKFYDLTKTAAKISTEGFQKLYLNNKFPLPNSPGNFLYSLNLRTQPLFSENISVLNLSIEVSPLTAAAEIETEFQAEISPLQNISDYEWDFGDGTTKTTNTTKIKHKYSNIDNYTLILTLNYDDNSSFSKEFIIKTDAPDEYINSTIEDIRLKLNNIKNQISGFEFFIKTQIQETLKLSEIEEKLENLSEEFSNASDQRILEIIRELQKINIPDKLIVSSIGEISFYFSEDDISLDTLSKVSEENYSSYEEKDIINAILYWSQNKFNTKISSTQISSQTGETVSHLLSVFEMNFDNSENSEPYLIVENLDNLKFQKESQDLLTHKAVKISSNSMKFSTTQNLNSKDIPAFISPKFSELQIKSNSGIIIEEESNKTWIWILIIGILLIGLITYYFLHRWYKRNYEKKLFKDRNNLYNLSHYINNARLKKIKDSEIKKKLKKTGWNAEQIRYAMRKYSGKNTGMFDLFGFFKKNNQYKTQKLNKQEKLK